MAGGADGGSQRSVSWGSSSGQGRLQFPYYLQLPRGAASAAHLLPPPMALAGLTYLMATLLP